MSIATSAMANELNMKQMLYQTIHEGKYEGPADPSIAMVYNIVAQSKSPVTLKMTRLAMHEEGCADIQFELSQKGAKGKDGKPLLNKDGSDALITNSFVMPICLNGNMPKKVVSDEIERRSKLMSSCKVSAIKGKQKEGKWYSEIQLRNCPSSKVVKASYEGNCAPIKMPPNSYYKYDLNNIGALDIKLQLPDTCFKEGTQNKWALNFFDLDMPFAPSLGIKSVELK